MFSVAILLPLPWLADGSGDGSGSMALCDPGLPGSCGRGCWCGTEPIGEDEVPFCRACSEVDCAESRPALSAVLAECCFSLQHLRIADLVPACSRSDAKTASGARGLQEDAAAEGATTAEEEDRAVRFTITFVFYMLVLSSMGVIGALFHYLCKSAPDLTHPGQVDVLLCCPGLYLFQVFLLMAAVKAAEVYLDDMFRDAYDALPLVEPMRIVISLGGIVMVAKRRQANKVTRGCDCCCSFPFPAWSLLLLQAWSLVRLAGRFAEESDVVSSFGIVASVYFDTVFAVMWLKALQRQDGSVCCGPSTLFTEDNDVVGKATGVLPRDQPLEWPDPFAEEVAEVA